MFNEVILKIVPRKNYRSEFKKIKSLNISCYSGFRKNKLIYVNLSDSNNILVYDLTSCSLTSYDNFKKELRTRCIKLNLI